MTASENLRLPLLCLTLGSTFALGACTSDDAASEAGDATETEGDGDGDPTGDGDGDPTGDGDGDADKPNLGDTPNVLCEAAIVNLDVIIGENDSADPDPLTIEAAYLDTGLQEFVQLAGAVTGRVEDGVLIDDAAIVAAITNGEALDLLDLLDIEWRIYLVMQQYIRHEISDVAATLPDPANDPALLYARWDAAYCYWDGALRPLGQIADGIGLPGDSIEADIDAAFERGHASIEGLEPWAIDEWELPAAKQQLEKTTYALAHRLVMQWSAEAASEADAALAREAHGAFQMIEDRIASKNTPAIAYIEDALLGDPSAIDADEILLDLNIAFAKRTRRYTDLAITDDLLGTPGAYAGANEGATYSKLIEPFMLELEGFDLDAYRQTWADWIDAIEADDLAAGQVASDELTQWNCQFQTALGIAECTHAIDETE